MSKKLPNFVEFVPEKAFRSFVVLIMNSGRAPENPSKTQRLHAGCKSG